MGQRARPKSQQKQQLDLGIPPVTLAVNEGQTKIKVVAGLDTSSSKFHLYCNDGYQTCHTIKTNSKGEPGPDERRHILHRKALSAFEHLPHGTLVICEEPLALKNGKTTRLLGLAAGAIWAAHLEFAVFWAWADVAAWKKSVIGNGNADKDMIKTWVQLYMGLEFPEDEPDYYDAAALSAYGEIRMGLRRSTRA